MLPASLASTDGATDSKAALCASALTSTHFNVRTAIPLLLTALASAYGFSDSQLGDIGAAYSVGTTLIALSSPIWLRFVTLRLGTTALMLLGTGSFAVAISLRSMTGLMIALALAGVGFGGVYSLMIAMISRSANPHRAFGWQWGLGSIPGVLLLYAMPYVNRPNGDMARPFLMLLILNAVAGLSIVMLPRGLSLTSPQPNKPANAAHTVGVLPISLALCAVTTTYLGLTGAWSFLDRVAMQAGLTPQYSGAVLAAAITVASLVAVFAGNWSHVAARIAPMTGAFLMMIAGLWLLSYSPTRTGFAAGSVVFLGLSTCVLTYTLGLVARLDVTGRAAALPAAALGIGSIVGPAMAGHIYQAAGAHGMAG